MPPRTLLPADLQNDLHAGDTSVVPEGDSMVDVANHLIDWCQSHGEAIVASQDWHSANHGSFASQHGVKPYMPGQLDGLPQTFWPDHCVQSSEGAQLHLLLHQKTIAAVLHEGRNPLVGSYSAFFDNGHRQRTPLDDRLCDHEIDGLVVMGLATGYCAKFTVLDVLQLGYKVNTVTDGCRGVSIQPQNSTHTFMGISAAGAMPYMLADWEKTQG